MSTKGKYSNRSIYISCQSVDELNILLEKEQRAEMKAEQRLALNAAPSVGRVSSN